MPLWRCPHCATPQPETARCWLCGRSTTSCIACRHYRRGVAGGLGLCGKRPGRLALRGTEVLPCWEAQPSPGDAPALRAAGGELRGREERQARTFVPVDDARPRREPPKPAVTAAPTPAEGARWSLWGDLEA